MELPTSHTGDEIRAAMRYEDARMGEVSRGILSGAAKMADHLQADVLRLREALAIACRAIEHEEWQIDWNLDRLTEALNASKNVPDA